MKKSLLIFGLAAIAATGVKSIADTLTGDRINTIKLITTEQFGVPYNTNLSEIPVNDIDSITFDVKNQKFSFFGCALSADNYYQSFAQYDLSKLQGFEFTYLPEGVMPTTCIDGALVNGTRNTVIIRVRPVEDAAGYQVRYSSNPTFSDWDNADAVDGEVSLGANDEYCVIPDLEYGTTYRFAVRVLSPKGEGYHSDWSTRHNFRAEQFNYLSIATYERYVVPNVMTYVNGKNEYEANLGFDLNYNRNNYLEQDADTIESRFEIDANNRFVADRVVLRPMNSHEETVINLTEADKEAGFVRVTGLEENTIYCAALFNSNIPAKVDAFYNWIAFRTKSSIPAEPVTLPAGTDLDEVLINYMSDYNIPDDQIYYLEGDGIYTLDQSVNITKGFILATRPEDLAAGRRAKVQFEVPLGSSMGPSFLLGMDGAKTEISKLQFKGIDFDVINAYNYGYIYDVGQATIHYFINSLMTVDYTIDELTIQDCTFQHFIRGFFRASYRGAQVINKFTVDGNLFYNCGYYDINGKGYAWFDGPDNNVETNPFKDFSFTNNTIYDSPRYGLIRVAKSLNWADDYKWNIKIENNTFINFSTRGIDNYILNMRYIPGGSHISFRRNLIALAADENDNRILNMCGADVRVVNGSGEFSYEIKDNYSVGCRDTHLVDDGIFTKGAFSLQKNSFGSLPGNMGTADDLKVKVGSTPLKSTDLFTNPNPPYVAYDPTDPNPLDHVAPDNIFEALKYKQTPEVLNHEIYTLGIGDPRWRE